MRRASTIVSMPGAPYAVVVRDQHLERVRVRGGVAGGGLVVDRARPRRDTDASRRRRSSGSGTDAGSRPAGASSPSRRRSRRRSVRRSPRAPECRPRRCPPCTRCRRPERWDRSRRRGARRGGRRRTSAWSRSGGTRRPGPSRTARDRCRRRVEMALPKSAAPSSWVERSEHSAGDSVVPPLGVHQNGSATVPGAAA